MSSPRFKTKRCEQSARMPKGTLPNEIESDDPMHHLFHVRNAGRFVLLARDSLPGANLWKDTRRNEPGSVDGPTVISPSPTRAG
jgi:hypothetical protein